MVHLDIPVWMSCDRDSTLDISLLLFGIAPLLIFVVVDSFCGIKSGVIAAIVLAVAEIMYTFIVSGTVDGFTIGSAALVLILGLASYKLENPIYMKLQPVVVGVILSLVFLVMQLAGKPLLVEIAQHYQRHMPEQMQAHLNDPRFHDLLARLSSVLGVGLLAHAALTAYAAFFLNNWWWIAFRGIGFYLVLAGCALWVR